MTLIEKPSQLPEAIGEVLKRAFPTLRVGNHLDFQPPGVLISIERNGPGLRSMDGRKAHALTVLLEVTVTASSAPFDACDLASQLMDVALDNRWGLPHDQCDLPANIVAAPSTSSSSETDYDTWTVSFTQTLYVGPSLIEDPTGKPLFACTWEVSNIDDPDQYRPLQE